MTRKAKARGTHRGVARATGRGARARARARERDRDRDRAKRGARTREMYGLTRVKRTKRIVVRDGC